MTEHFSSQEMSCKCGYAYCTAGAMDEGFMVKLERLRVNYGIPMKINSGVRCPKHNEAIGGSVTSSHLCGMAADISIIGASARSDFLGVIYETKIFTRIGIAKTFIHVDSDPSKRSKKVWVY